MVVGVVVIGLLGWWWVNSQRQAVVTAAATATAVTQATVWQPSCGRDRLKECVTGFQPLSHSQTGSPCG